MFLPSSSSGKFHLENNFLVNNFLGISSVRLVDSLAPHLSPSQKAAPQESNMKSRDRGKQSFCKKPERNRSEEMRFFKEF